MSAILSFPPAGAAPAPPTLLRPSAGPGPLADAGPEPGLRRGSGLAVRLSGLTRRFDGRTVLDGLDLDIASGEFVALVGRSGCGKSTLLRLLAGLDTPDAGCARLAGRPVAGPVADARILFQDARLLPWRRVLDNVGLGLSGRSAAGDWRARARALLARVGLAERAGDWPAVLSGGQRQRVALARALIHAPHLLLLDEPLGALDALTRIDMQRLIEALWRDSGFTTVLVTHDVAEAIALADRVILLDAGRIALDLRIDLPRPRARGSAAFAALEGQVLRQVLGSD